MLPGQVQEALAMGSRFGDSMRCAAVNTLTSITFFGRAATRGAAQGMQEVGLRPSGFKVPCTMLVHLSC